MAIIGSQPVKVRIPRTTQEEQALAQTSDFLEGYWPDVDSLILPVNGLTYASNVAYFKNQLWRRNGQVPYDITAPDSEQIMGLFAFYIPSIGFLLFRFSPDKIYKVTSSGWVEITPNAVTLNGGVLNYYNTTFIDSRIFFTNDGIDPIYEIDTGTDEYKAVGNAPSARYITSAFNRLIAAFITGAPDIPFRIQWCGESNYTQWDPTIDISAGQQDLITSPSNISDDITGVLTAAQSLIVPRQRSMWIGTHLPSATTPFSFFPQLPRLGADLPRTILLTEKGLIWLNAQTTSVYVWDLSTTEVPTISEKVRRELKAALQLASQVWAAYSHEIAVYTLFFSYQSESVVRYFEYSFDTKTWVIGEYPNSPTVCSDIDFSSSVTSINDLTGTIDDLVGPIDSLGGLIQTSNRYFGYADGTITYQTFYSGSGDITLDDNGTEFISRVQSKNIQVPITDTFINLIRLQVAPFSTGSVTLSYSKDNGNTWTVAKTVTFTETGKYQLVQLRKAIKAEYIMWKAETDDCMCTFNGFYIQLVKAGITHD